MKRQNTWRKLDGILLLDKPSGISSNAALQAARRLFNAVKAGHTGSLDPLASGLLPICFGEATKLSGLLLESNKRYQFTLQLGSQTSTGDAEGAVVATAACSHITLAAVEAAAQQFLGDQQQVPPMYSALKHDGERLYALARQGIEVERPARAVTIYSLEVRGLQEDRLELEVHCSKGTYVRSLGEDLARALGTLAHVQALRRIAAGPFTGPIYSLEDLGRMDFPTELDACLLPPSAALKGWPSVNVDAESTRRLRLGQAVRVQDSPVSGELALYDNAGHLLGIGKVLDDGRVAPCRVLIPPSEQILTT